MVESQPIVIGLGVDAELGMLLDAHLVAQLPRHHNNLRAQPFDQLFDDPANALRDQHQRRHRGED